MGMFDSLYVPCPKCGKNVEFQSKASHCMMDTWRSFDDAPRSVLIDVMNEPHYHQACGSWVALIDPALPPGWRPSLQTVLVKAPAKPEVHSSGFQWWPDEQPFTMADVLADCPDKTSMEGK